jgi:regulator of sigma E protease
MSGPVGIYKVTASVTENGQVAEIFYLMALLSVNIGIFNLMPVPGLDGAQTLFAIVEGVIGRELPINVKYALQAAGLGLILLLMFYITFQDIIKLF